MAQQLQALEKESRMRELEVADLRADVDCYRDDAELLRQHLALLHQRYVEDWQEAQAVFERSRSLAAHANPKQKLKLAELLSEQVSSPKRATPAAHLKKLSFKEGVCGKCNSLLS